jgi:hypothetical protein
MVNEGCRPDTLSPMKSRFLQVAIALGLAAGAFAVLRSTPAEAGDGIDCHSLGKWEKSKAYKEGSLIWGENSDSHSAGSEYKCSPRTADCHNPYEPKNNSEWALVGACKSGTKP